MSCDLTLGLDQQCSLSCQCQVWFCGQQITLVIRPHLIDLTQGGGVALNVRQMWHMCILNCLYQPIGVTIGFLHVLIFNVSLLTWNKVSCYHTYVACCVASVFAMILEIGKLTSIAQTEADPHLIKWHPPHHLLPMGAWLHWPVPSPNPYPLKFPQNHHSAFKFHRQWLPFTLFSSTHPPLFRVG